MQNPSFLVGQADNLRLPTERGSDKGLSGNVSRQVNVRRYMDYLRIEGELNVLGFMPQELRLPMLQSWYVGADRFFTIVVNRWHDNVNAMFRESDTLDPAKDAMDFIPGSIGSYPNYFLDFPGDEVSELFDLLANFDGSPAYIEKLRKYGVDRSDERFWKAYDFFQGQLDTADPLHAGLYDLNRYYSKASPATP